MRIACEGAPRDLGYDQGRAMGEGVDAELVRILRARPPDTALAEMGRDVERHFPHLAERMVGLARGANVERRALVVALARAAGEPGFLFRPARAMARRAPGAAAAGIAARFDLGADRCSVPVVRRSRPHGGFESLELTLPWLAASLGGVNARGLAATLGPPGPALPSAPAEGREEPCRAPALLFVQQCLERFDRVGTAVDWCMTRPAWGSMTLLLADAEGGVAAVAFDEERRTVLPPDGEGRFSLAPASVAVGEALLPVQADDVASWASVLGDREAPGGDLLAHRVFLALDPRERSLAMLLDPEGLASEPRAERFRIDPAEA